MTNKELVAAGHAFAKAQDADAPLTEIAKLVSDLATRLDVITVRAGVLAVENLSLKNYIDGECYIESKRTGVYTCAGINKPEAPDTDTILNEVRAEGIDYLASEAGEMTQKFKQGSSDWKRWKSIVFFAVTVAAQLRATKDGDHV